MGRAPFAWTLIPNVFRHCQKNSSSSKVSERTGKADPKENAILGKAGQVATKNNLFSYDNTNFKRKTVTKQPFQGQGRLFHQLSNFSLFAYVLRKLHVHMSNHS